MHPTALAISVALIPSLRSDTMREQSKVDRAALVDPLRLCGVCRLTKIADEAKLHSATRPAQ